MLFDLPGGYDTYEVVVEARLKEPGPTQVDNFIRQLNQRQNLEEVRDWIR
jgi:hypothetical protein